MGILDEVMNSGERTRLLESLTVKQLKSLADEKGVDVKPRTGFAAFGQSEGKALLVERLDADTTRLPFAALKAHVEALRAQPAPAEPRPARLPEPVAVETQTMTPTLAPSRSMPMVSFDEVYAYLDQYRFISRHDKELHYEIELSGALREKFGVVMRQLPVPGTLVPSTKSARPRSIDLDVGGIGIELKYDLATSKEVAETMDQLTQYKQHYGEKLILMLIATHGQPAFVSQIRASGLAHVIER